MPRYSQKNIISGSGLYLKFEKAAPKQSAFLKS
jgi:hypothetical protein